VAYTYQIYHTLQHIDGNRYARPAGRFLKQADAERHAEVLHAFEMVAGFTGWERIAVVRISPTGCQTQVWVGTPEGVTVASLDALSYRTRWAALCGRSAGAAG
jgi:hypothetical protein